MWFSLLLKSWTSASFFEPVVEFVV